MPTLADETREEHDKKENIIFIWRKLMTFRFVVPYSDPRWWWEGPIPKCFHCDHFRGLVDGKKRCLAFPDGIPGKFIADNKIIHDQPYPGDNGIRFKQWHYDEAEVVAFLKKKAD